MHVLDPISSGRQGGRSDRHGEPGGPTGPRSLAASILHNGGKTPASVRYLGLAGFALMHTKPALCAIARS